MSHTLYSATGCVRCKIVKTFMEEKEINYTEVDFKADGMDDFRKFYRSNRKHIFRGKDGVEFPVYSDGKVIRQGAGVVLAYLQAKGALDNTFTRSELTHDWLDGINISTLDETVMNDFTIVLSHLKANGLKLQINSDGRNSNVLKTLLDNSLCDRLLVEIKGPVSLYPAIVGTAITKESLSESLRLATQFPDYTFFSTILPLIRKTDGKTAIEYLSPEEVGATAQFIESATGSKKHPYQLVPCDPSTLADERLHNIELLPQPAFYKYRTAARRYQVMTEIKKI